MTNRRGLTLIELMVTLTIGATLMLTVATAFNASSKAVALNDANFRCTQSARAAMGQIVAELRRADAVKVDRAGGWVELIRPKDQLTRDELYRRYAWDEQNHRITLQIFFTGSQSSALYDVATGVTAVRFSSAAEDAGEQSRSVARVSVSITCEADGSSVTLEGSAVPRRMRNAPANP